MKNVLIVFSGKAQSGKTTASNILSEVAKAQLPPNYDFNIHGPVKIFSFATALKQIAQEYFNWTGDKGIYYEDTTDTGSVDIHGDGQTPAMGRMPIKDKGRQLLINIGQYMRAIRPTIWVDYVINQIKKEGSTGTNKVFIIDDMRFSNELIMAKTFYACVSVRLKRNSELHLDDTSETDLDNAEFDYYIENNGHIDDLKIEMSGLFEKIKLKYQQGAA